MDKQEELINRLRNANSDFGIDDDLTKEAANEIEELRQDLDCMTRQANELKKMYNHLDAASKASEKLHQIAMAGKEEVIKVLQDDLRYYRKDWKDQMIQDQGNQPVDP